MATSGPPDITWGTVADGRSRLAVRYDGRRPRESLFDFREHNVETGGEGERRQGRADRQGEPDDHEVQRRTGDPTREGGPPPAGRPLEEIASRIPSATHEKGLRDHDSQERDEEASNQEEERLIGSDNTLARGDQVPCGRDDDEDGGHNRRRLFTSHRKILDGHGRGIHIRDRKSTRLN